MTVVERFYVRLSPTVLFLVPSCYGRYSKECDGHAHTLLCPVRNQCVEGVVAVLLSSEVPDEVPTTSSYP